MIKLLPFEEKDFEQLISWVDSEALLFQFAGTVLFKYPLTKSQLFAYLSDNKRFAFKVIETKTKESIGHAEIYLDQPKMSRLCRILIGKAEHRGKGYGEAVVGQLIDFSREKLQVEMVELNVYEWNTPAIKCYEKAGFKINPSGKKTREVNGTIWTSINMRLIFNQL